jgi:hypothetical protein
MMLRQPLGRLACRRFTQRHKGRQGKSMEKLCALAPLREEEVVAGAKKTIERKP